LCVNISVYATINSRYPIPCLLTVCVEPFSGTRWSNIYMHIYISCLCVCVRVRGYTYIYLRYDTLEVLNPMVANRMCLPPLSRYSSALCIYIFIYLFIYIYLFYVYVYVSVCVDASVDVTMIISRNSPKCVNICVCNSCSGMRWSGSVRTHIYMIWIYI